MGIIIIGVTGAGKTTIGRKLAKRLSYKFVDMDRFVEKKSGKTVAELFAISEYFFRQKELAAAKSLSNKEKIVIATGGGAVLQEDLMNILCASGTVIYISRPVSEILRKLDVSRRPMLKGNPQRLYKIFEERRELYEKYAQITIENEGPLSKTIDRIILAMEAKENENNGN